MSLQRRTFLLTVVSATGAVALAPSAHAQPAVLDEKDPQAASLGYVTEAKRADVKKFPKYAAGQQCGTCALYQGKAGDKSGPCPLFGGRLVNAGGWCSAWAKKG